MIKRIKTTDENHLSFGKVPLNSSKAPEQEANVENSAVIQSNMKTWMVYFNHSASGYNKLRELALGVSGNLACTRFIDCPQGISLHPIGTCIQFLFCVVLIYFFFYFLLSIFMSFSKTPTFSVICPHSRHTCNKIYYDY